MLKHSPILYWSFCCVIIFLVYAPGWYGPFVFDDQLNILENPNVPIETLNEQEILRSTLSNESGPLKRVIPALSFGLNYYFASGFEPVHFKLTNIAVHCINSGLVFWLLTLLWPCLSQFNWAKQSRLANPQLTFVVCGTLIWALHPFLLTSVLYVVQRMTSMASMFMLMGTCLYVVGRLTLNQKRFTSLALMSLGLIGGTVLGAASKENALLLPVYIGALEFTLLSTLTLNKKALRSLYWFYFIFLGIPIIAALVYWSLHPTFITGGYNSRPFTLLERVLTEPRVLWFYLYMIFVPNIETMGLFHDDFSLSSDLTGITTTVPSILGIAIILGLSFYWRKRFPVFAFSALWFLVGHSLESSIVALEIIHEHRNYLPALGPLLGLTYLLVFSLPDKMPSALRAGLLLIIIFCLGFSTFNRSQYWQSEASLIESLSDNHPDSPSSQYLRGEILRKRNKDFESAYAYYLRAAELAPNEVGFLISLSMVTPDTFKTAEWPIDSIKLAEPTYIEKIIYEQPVGAWGIRALDVAIKCVLSGNQRCLAKADDVSLWLNALINKPKGKGAHQYYGVIHLFAVKMKQNRFVDALKAANMGAQLNPQNPRFVLMQSHALVGLKRLEEANQLLDNVAQSPAGKVKKYAQRVQQLKTAIQLIEQKKAIGDTPG